MNRFLNLLEKPQQIVIDEEKLNFWPQQSQYRTISQWQNQTANLYVVRKKQACLITAILNLMKILW